MDLSALPAAATVAYAAVAGSRGRGSLEERIAALRALQAARNVLDACETELMGQVAAIELIAAEDGTLVEVHRPIGHQELDGPELVAPCVGASVQAVAGRMSTALAMLTRTPALVAEMAAGRLDGFRARVVSDELDDAPAETAAVVVSDLIARAEAAGGWVQSAGPLRRRVATTLARIDGAVTEARRERELARRGLTRRVESSGLDRWDGVYPVEQARLAWEAVDARAREILDAGEADGLAQARADAHLQLLLAQVTATIHLHPTVASDAAPALAGATLLGAAVPGAAVPGSTPRNEVEGTAGVELRGFAGAESVRVDPARLGRALREGSAVVEAPVTCHPDTGAALGAPTGFTGTRRRGGEVGAVEERYRPSAALRSLVELRDGTCRFPGCRVPSRSCDLDHVRPWPTGPTALDNLMALCRHHHRIKQRPGWRVRLRPDGVVEWHYPDGRTCTTDPVDHLDTTRPLLGAAADVRPPPLAPLRARPRDRIVDVTDDYGLRDHSPLVEHYARLERDHAALPATARHELVARARADRRSERLQSEFPVLTLSDGTTVGTRVRRQLLAAPTRAGTIKAGILLATPVGPDEPPF